MNEKRNIKKLVASIETTRFHDLQNHYEGDSKIMERTMDDGKPNNKIPSSFAISSVDTMTGYFMGKPVIYSASEDSDWLEELTMVFDANDEYDINAEHAKQACIKGRSYELVFADEEGDLRFAQLNRENCVLVYDDKIIPKLIGAIIVTKRGTTEHPEKVMVYDDQYETHYTYTDNGYVEDGKYDHYFKEVPVVDFSLNKEGIGLFEKALPNIYAYDKAVSDTANDLEYFTDAYLWLPGFADFDSSDEDDMKKIVNMRNNRVFLPSGNDLNDKPEFITKIINDQASENHKDRIKEEIYKIINMPDLSDESFAGQQSGVSLAYKLWGLENVCGAFERRFKKALMKRIRLVATYLNYLSPEGSQAYDHNSIDMQFTRNLPDNTLETVELVEKMRGILSDETLISQFDFIDDAVAEIERRDAEQEGKVDLDRISGVNYPEDEESDSGVI